MMQISPEICTNCVLHANKEILDLYNKCIISEVEPLKICKFRKRY